MADLWKEIIPSILQTKQNMMRDEVDEKEYKAFIVNKALSYHKDCIFYVNEINKNPHLDIKLQYAFFLNIIRSMKRRFQPWQKALVLKDLDCIKEYYGFSDLKAEEALHILTQDQIAEIRKRIEKGGVK